MFLVKLGLVVGKVYSSVQNPVFDRQRLLLVRPLDLDRRPKGRVMLGIDTVDAGEGDVVLLLQEGRSTRDYTQVKNAPARTAIVAVVDRIDVDETAGLPAAAAGGAA